MKLRTKYFFSNKAESISGFGHHNPLPYSVSIRNLGEKKVVMLIYATIHFCQILLPFFLEGEGVGLHSVNTRGINSTFD